MSKNITGSAMIYWPKGFRPENRDIFPDDGVQGWNFIPEAGSEFYVPHGTQFGKYYPTPHGNAEKYVFPESTWVKILHMHRGNAYEFAEFSWEEYYSDDVVCSDCGCRFRPSEVMHGDKIDGVQQYLCRDYCWKVYQEYQHVQQ